MAVWEVAESAEWFGRELDVPLWEAAHASVRCARVGTERRAEQARPPAEAPERRRDLAQPPFSPTATARRIFQLKRTEPSRCRASVSSRDCSILSSWIQPRFNSIVCKVCMLTGPGKCLYVKLNSITELSWTVVVVLFIVQISRSKNKKFNTIYSNLIHTNICT